MKFIIERYERLINKENKMKTIITTLILAFNFTLSASVKFINKSPNDFYVVKINGSEQEISLRENSETNFFRIEGKKTLGVYLRNELIHESTVNFVMNMSYAAVIGDSRSGFYVRSIGFTGLEKAYLNPEDIPTENNIFSRELLNTANVQIIHNSPYPVVDIYVDNVEALSDIPYRATTGLIELPLSTTVGIAPADGEIIAEFPFTLEADAHYVVTASGIVGSAETPFNLVASALETAAIDNDHFGLKVYHGVTDAPAVDIYADGGLLIENLSFGEYAGYVQVPVGDYTIDVTAHGASTPVASFSAPLSGQCGGTGIVFASGFLAPADTDSAFTLVLTTPSGYNVELPNAATALSTTVDSFVNPNVFKLKQNYPNPFNPSTSIDFEVFESSKVSLNVYDLSGRLVKNLLSGNLNSGAYTIEWNGKNTTGISSAAGVYFYSLSSGESTIIKKMSLIK